MIRILLTCIFCKRRGNLLQDFIADELPEKFYVGCDLCQRKILVTKPKCGSVSVPRFLSEGGMLYPYLSVTVGHF